MDHICWTTMILIKSIIGKRSAGLVFSYFVFDTGGLERRMLTLGSHVAAVIAGCQIYHCPLCWLLATHSNSSFKSLHPNVESLLLPSFSLPSLIRSSQKSTYLVVPEIHDGPSPIQYSSFWPIHVQIFPPFKHPTQHHSCHPSTQSLDRARQCAGSV